MPNSPATFSGNLARGVFWVSAGAFAVRVIGFATSVFLLHTFTLHEYGTYQLVLSVAGLLALITLQGIDEVILAAGAKSVGEGDESKTQNLLRGYWMFKLVTGCLVWAFILFASDILKNWYSDDILGLLQTYAWVFLLLPFERIILFSFSSRRQFHRLSLYGLVQEVTKLVAIVLFVAIFHMGIIGVLYAMILAMCSTIMAFGIVPISRMFIGWRGASWGPFLDLLQSQGGWTIGQRLLRQGEKNLRPLFIQLFLGREAVALFSFAEKVYGYIAGAFPLGDVLMPSMASESNNRERLQRVLERGIKYTIPFYSLIALFLAAAAPFVIRLAFPQYGPAIPILYTVLCYIPFVGIAYLMTSFFVSHQEQSTQFWAMCIREICFLVLLPTAIFFFGTLGVGVEFALTLFLYNGIRLILLLRKYPELHVSFSGLFRIDSYDRALFKRLSEKVRRRFHFSNT